MSHTLVDFVAVGTILTPQSRISSKIHLLITSLNCITNAIKKIVVTLFFAILDIIILLRDVGMP